jgi:uncharacterized membrane protein YhdT
LAKVLFAAGLTSFILAFFAEIAFILLGLTAVSGGSSDFPTWISGLVIWGCIVLGVLCWMIAAALALIDLFKNRP